jgi:hypothetical protein
MTRAKRGCDCWDCQQMKAEIKRLRLVLDWIYAEPEDPEKVQKRAREALDAWPITAHRVRGERPA